MSSRTPTESSSTTQRRTPRPWQAVAAGLLVASAVAAVVAGAVIGTVPVLTAAAAYAVAVGAVIVVLFQSVVLQVRRLWAHDRANLAGAYRREAVARAAEQSAFADAMAARLADERASVARLEEDIVRAEHRRDELGTSLAAEQERSAELQTDVASLEASLEQAQDDLTHLRDALTASEAAEKRARAEVLAWEAESRQLA